MADTKLQFRLATPEDAEPVRKLIENSFRARDTREDWTADMGLGAQFTMALETVMKLITQPDSEVIMAFDSTGNNLLGTVDVTKKDNVGRVSMLAVAEGQQQGGLGRQLLAKAEDYCQKEWGCTVMGLNALSTRERLMEWYGRRGYVKTGETNPFPVDKVKDLVLPADLCFVEMEKDLSKFGDASA